MHKINDDLTVVALKRKKLNQSVLIRKMKLIYNNKLTSATEEYHFRQYQIIEPSDNNIFKKSNEFLIELSNEIKNKFKKLYLL